MQGDFYNKSPLNWRKKELTYVIFMKGLGLSQIKAGTVKKNHPVDVKKKHNF